jgi:alkylhydroperoxidase family enzyme
MEAFIKPPKRIPFIIRVGMLITKKATGKDLLAPKILSWYPKAAISSGILESMAAHGKKDLNARILKLVRMSTSFAVSCAFCIDMNSFKSELYHITEEEIKALQNNDDVTGIQSLTVQEKLAIQYSRYASSAPLHFPREFIDELKDNFTEREIVILASTAAQVNYWARLIQALGIPPAGFSEQCSLAEKKQAEA